MEQLVILVLIGLVSLINWLVQKSAEQRDKRKAEAEAQGGGELRQPPAREIRPAGADDAARRLREALGLPDDEELPPPLPRAERTEPPQLPEPFLTEAVPPPVIREAARAFVPVAEPAARPAVPRVPPMKSAPAAPAFVTRAEPSRFRALIATSAGARDAVVLAEILGPPKSQQNS